LLCICFPSGMCDNGLSVQNCVLFAFVPFHAMKTLTEHQLSSTYSWPWYQIKVSCKLHVQVSLAPGKKKNSPYSLNRRPTEVWTFRRRNKYCSCQHSYSVRTPSTVYDSGGSSSSSSSKGKGKAFPLQAFHRPLGFQEVEAPRISRQSALEGGKVVSPTHRPSLPQEGFLVLISAKRLSRPQGHNATGRIKSLKNSSDSLRNRTGDLPVCSAVPQPTAPPRTPVVVVVAVVVIVVVVII
jgi:hypothetical protein